MEGVKASQGSSNCLIVICDDTDDKEQKQQFATYFKEPFTNAERCEETQQDMHSYAQKNKGRMRSKPKRKGVVPWTVFEDNILSELRGACDLQDVY